MNIDDMILWIKKSNSLVERDNKSMFSTWFWFSIVKRGLCKHFRSQIILDLHQSSRVTWCLMNSIASTFLRICYFLKLFREMFWAHSGCQVLKVFFLLNVLGEPVFSVMAVGWFCEMSGWIGKVEDVKLVLLKKNGFQSATILRRIFTRMNCEIGIFHPIWFI